MGESTSKWILGCVSDQIRFNLIMIPV